MLAKQLKSNSCESCFFLKTWFEI